MLNPSQELAAAIPVAVSQIIVDAASYEQLSSRMLTEGANCDGRDPLCPNLRATTLDMMHRSGRALSRTFATSEMMQCILDKFVTGPYSIVQKIDHSPSLRDEFQKFVKDTDGTPNVKNVRGALHRAHCLQKTLGRATVHIDALIGVAEHVIVNRVGDPVKHCRQFLDALNDETYLMLGLMADAADEVMIFKEFVDDETMELASSVDELRQLIDRLKHLFLGPRGACLQSGYAAFALKELEKPKLVKQSGGISSLGKPGGPSGAVIQRCRERMEAWCVTTLKLLEAEFPSFELVCNFSVFSLGQQRKDALGNPADSGT